MKKIFYNKLIRDKIPEKIRKNGAEFKIRPLSAREFEKELLKKVGEEASGLLASKTKTELVLELADIVAVLNEIKKLKHISEKEMAEAMRVNFAKKGGFKKKLFLAWSSDTGYKTNERMYKKLRGAP